MQIGTLEYIKTKGQVPYLMAWSEMQAIHPLFAMAPNRLLAFARSEYERQLQIAEDGECTDREKETLQVAWLAVLHSLGSIQQDAPALPPYYIVHKTIKALFSLAYWKAFLESQRFAFPTFKITKLNKNQRFENVDYYLEACFEIKDNYEKGLKDLVERDKVRAAERALAALRSQWALPKSKRALWAWVRANLPEKFQTDAANWMGTIFLGNEKTILDWDWDEILMMESIIIGECPQGTGILHAVRQRIDEIKKVHTDYKEAFTVDISFTAPLTKANEQGELVKIDDPRPERKDFATNVLFIKANAAWYLRQPIEVKMRGM